MIHAYIHTYTYIYIYMCIYIYMYMYMYMSMYMYMYIPMYDVYYVTLKPHRTTSADPPKAPGFRRQAVVALAPGHRLLGRRLPRRPGRPGY